MKYQTSSMPGQPLKTEPRNVLPDNHKAFNLQTSSTPVLKLQTEPSTVKYGAGTPQGTFQTSADTVKLNKTPMSGWQSWDTPVSDRTIAQKKNY